MSLLTGRQIHEEVKNGTIRIDPFHPERLNPNSYNLAISDKLLVYKKNYHLHTHQEGSSFRSTAEPYAYWLDPLTMMSKEETQELIIPKEGLTLYPGILYLGSTLEYTETHGFVPRIDGRSSGGRLGLSVHETAGLGDTGFKGHWTLEITVVYPLIIHAYLKIAQISYSTIVGEIDNYCGKYQDAEEVQASRLYKELKTTFEK